MSIANLVLIALGIFAALIVGGALIGAIVNLFRCLFFAAVAAIGATFVIRLWLMRRSPPASGQIVDQPTPSRNAIDEADLAQKQIEERIRRLQRDDANRDR